MVVVVSDSAVKGAAKVDGRATSRILQAAQENDASQFVLVTPGGSGGGGFFGALFGTPSVGGSGRKPSKIEQVRRPSLPQLESCTQIGGQQK